MKNLKLKLKHLAIALLLVGSASASVQARDVVSFRSSVTTQIKSGGIGNVSSSLRSTLVEEVKNSVTYTPRAKTLHLRWRHITGSKPAIARDQVYLPQMASWGWVVGTKENHTVCRIRVKYETVERDCNSINEVYRPRVKK